jgi:hypothetical protein|tara:strand:- start:1813 stop:2037 length:225 start_codon:yes stop_codon:yes gene_type:complete
MTENSTVSYGRTINLGNYNNEKIDVQLIVQDDETPEECLGRAYFMVTNFANGTTAQRMPERKIPPAPDPEELPL